MNDDEYDPRHISAEDIDDCNGSSDCPAKRHRTDCSRTENVETRCDHLGFDTVDPDDPGNDNGVFGKSVCPRCWGTGIIHPTPENVDSP